MAVSLYVSHFVTVSFCDTAIPIVTVTRRDKRSNECLIWGTFVNGSMVVVETGDILSLSPVML